jgi:putative membrane protein
MRTKRTLSIAAALSLAGFAAFADDLVKQKAQDFATKAVIANMFEVEAADVEVKNGKDGKAVKFATDMLNDHGKAGPELKAAAKQDGVAVPAVLDADYKAKIDALKASDTTNLDQAYLSTQLTAHQDSVALFEGYANSGPEGHLRNVASRILPDLRAHLVRVQGLTSK